MTRVLLTGATGFIGSPTLAALVDAGHDVHAVARRAGPAMQGVTWYEVDLLAAGEPRRLGEAVRPEALLHLAWCAEPGTYLTSPANLDWLAASVRLLRAVHDAGCRRSIVTGTCLEYAPLQAPAVEQAAVVPDTPYAAAKHALHIAASSWAAGEGHALAWARIFHLFGPGEPEGRLVPTVARAALGGGTAALSSGVQLRDFLYVDDVADALVAILTSDVVGPVNVGSGRSTAVADLAALVATQAGRPEAVQLGARVTADQDRLLLVADVQRLHEEVGWRPTVTVDEGVRRSVAWWAAR